LTSAFFRPEAIGFLRLRQNPCPFFLGHAANDGSGGQLLLTPADQIDFLGNVVVAGQFSAAVKQHRLTQSNPIACLQQMFLDALAVDPGAVAGTQIHHHIASFRATEFRMASGNLSVLQSDTVAGIPANRNYRTVQAKAFALQGPLHNDQCRRHRFPLISSEPCPPFSTHISILIIAPRDQDPEQILNPRIQHAHLHFDYCTFPRKSHNRNRFHRSTHAARPER
jgi:hypothetical protein